MTYYALFAGRWREVTRSGDVYTITLGGRLGLLCTERAWQRRLALGTAREVIENEAA